MNRTAQMDWMSPLTLVLLPVVGVAASALTLTLLVAPEWGAGVLAAVVAARFLLGVVRWGYVLYLSRRHLRAGVQRLGWTA